MCEDTYEVIGATCSSETHIVAGQSEPPFVSIRQHTSAHVHIRQHTSAYVRTFGTSFSQRKHLRASVAVCILSMTVRYTFVLVKQAKLCVVNCVPPFATNMSAPPPLSASFLSRCVVGPRCLRGGGADICGQAPAYVSLRQHTSAYVSIVCEEEARIYVVRHLHLRVAA